MRGSVTRDKICMRGANVCALPVHGSVTLIEFTCMTLILGEHIVNFCKQVAAVLMKLVI
jgi:hypothetical protein